MGITSTMRTWSATTALGTRGPATISGMCTARVIDEEAVGDLAVLAQHLPVVGQHRDHRVAPGVRPPARASSRRPTWTSVNAISAS